MTTTYIESKLVLSVTLIAAVAASVGLGPVAVLAPEGASPLGAGYQLVADADAAAALLTATNITADGAAQLTAAFSQDFTPTAVYVATYDDATEDPSDAIDILIAAGIDVQVLVPATVVDADLAALGTWLAVGTRKWEYLVIAETLAADALTSGKPAALTTCEVSSFRMLYGAATIGLAGGVGGKLQGRGLVVGPAAAESRILTVALPGITAAEAAFALANDIGALYPMDAGAGATERIVRGTANYNADGFSPVVSLLYAVRLMKAALQALLAAKAVKGDPLLATAVGAAEVQGALVVPLAAMAGQGHFVPGTSGTPPNEVALPDGYIVTVTVVGSTLQAAVTMLLGQEVETITLAVTGEIV